MKPKQEQKDKTELWAGVNGTIALLFMLFVYAPIEIYCYNQDEFWFGLSEILPIIVFLFVGGGLFCAITLLLVNKYLPGLYRSIVLPGISIVFLCTYIQGNFLVSNLPPMDGSVPAWSDYKTEIIQSLILWSVVSSLIVILYKRTPIEKFVKAVQVVSVCMMLMLSVTTISVLLTTGGYKSRLDACSTTKNQYVYSEEQNYIIFILDMVDSKDLSNLMNSNPKYEEIFEDFTYYKNMMGAYSCTEVAVSHILSGEWFENEIPIEEYVVNSFDNSPILNILDQKGYILGMYEYEMPYESRNVFRFDNVLNRNSKVSSYVDLAKLELKLVGIRYAPFPLKLFCVFNSARFAALWERTDEHPVFIAENRTFYKRMQEEEITTINEKCFKFIHIEGGHVPFQYDENVNYIEDGTYSGNLKATLTIVDAYLEKLKTAGVYDNSVIIIMSDHGYDDAYGVIEDVEACENRQNPIFFVKGIDERHEMAVSQAPVSYSDLQSVFVKLLEGKHSNEIFEYQDGDTRERRYIYYDFVEDEYMYEYISTGHASDDEAMVFTGNTYIRE